MSWARLHPLVADCRARRDACDAHATGRVARVPGGGCLQLSNFFCAFNASNSSHSALCSCKAAATRRPTRLRCASRCASRQRRRRGAATAGKRKQREERGERWSQASMHQQCTKIKIEEQILRCLLLVLLVLHAFSRERAGRSLIPGSPTLRGVPDQTRHCSCSC
jgi:hypothetical protein